MFCVSLFNPQTVWAQLDFESEPINYNTSPVSDPIETLRQKVEAGDATLKHDSRSGYLESVLEHLDIPVSSQMLVFSKTSFQLRRITSQRPRAVYFSDDVYVGWVQGGDVVEIASADPELGAIFYTLSQKQMERPKIMRDRGQCIVCHASSRTSGVPGHLVRSVYASKSGQPYFGSGTFTTDHRSPFEKRWGGWYVTGTHGKQRHMGNVIATDSDRTAKLDTEKGANVTDLSDRLNTKPYLSPHSDIVALMVLEHQSRMHNLITRANFETRAAHHHDKVMNKAMDRPADYRSDSTKRRIATAANNLVEYMLFADEFELTDSVEGTSQFASEFSSRGPRDSKGRSLRDLDLNKRMMKYPCSYLVYSKPFDNLPEDSKEQVYRRLFDILSGQDDSEQFSHLTATDRKAILEILLDTKPDLPSYWNDNDSQAARLRGRAAHQR
ncbi:MAG: hypothetical protein GY768_05345 [Planctomycetaceae bacterium]|nr:hypothetical protein [Planctomycetaceae bacterium]